MSGGDHDTDLLDGLGELIRLHGAVVVQVEVLESLEEHSLLIGRAGGLLRKLLFESLLEAIKEKKQSLSHNRCSFSQSLNTRGL